MTVSFNFVSHNDSATKHATASACKKTSLKIKNVPRIGGSHMASLKFKLQNYWFSRGFTFMMYKSSWKLILAQTFAPNVFLSYTTLELLSFCVTYFGEFDYLNKTLLQKSVIFMFLSSSRGKFTLLKHNSVTDVSVGLRPPCWCPSHQHGASIQVSINLVKHFSEYLA